MLSYLYLLSLDTLAIELRENVHIKRIVIEGQHTEILQHADDAIGVLLDIDSARV